MKRTKLSALLIVAALSILAVGSAALTSIYLDRNVSAGSVLKDTDTGVAIQFTPMNGYDTKNIFVTDSSTGEVSFDLTKAVATGKTLNGWNTDARFLVGSASTPVFSLTNNSDLAVTVNFNDSAIQGVDVVNLIGSSTIAAGATQEYYFNIDTSNGAAGDATKTLGGILEIRGGTGTAPVNP